MSSDIEHQSPTSEVDSGNTVHSGHPDPENPGRGSCFYSYLNRNKYCKALLLVATLAIACIILFPFGGTFYVLFVLFAAVGLGYIFVRRRQSSHHGHESPGCGSCFYCHLNRIKCKPLKILITTLAIAVIILFQLGPLIFLLVAFLLIWPGHIFVRKKADVSSSAQGIVGIYKQSRRIHTLVDHIRLGFQELLVRVSLLLGVWLIINLSDSTFKGDLKILGSPMWRWDILALIITFGYFAALLMYLIPVGYQRLKMKLTKMCFTCTCCQLVQTRTADMGYFYYSLLPSAGFVIYFGLILVLWLVYFRTEHGLGSASNRSHPGVFIKYVTWTCVSLFVGSILWLVKTFLLLKWKADAIYRRFEPKILMTGVKFMYLRIVIGCLFEQHIISELGVLDQDAIARHSEPTIFSFTNHLMSRKLNITSLYSVGRFLTSLATSVRSQEEDGIPSVVAFLQGRITNTDERCELQHLVELLKGDNEPALFPSEDYLEQTANVLYGIVREQCGSDEFTFNDLKKWMVDAHKNSVNMGRTLADASAMVTRLDIFISFIISIAVVLPGLLITRVATTKALVSIATPMLALTFIFGDSAKAFFQGIIFCFATQAFNVGDRCILDETELEVESISILTTTFNKIGTMEKRMYPNSVLATKAIANLGWQPDPTDVVELTLDSSTTPAKLQMLEDKIQQFFRDPQQRGSFDKKHEVMMKEIGDRIKVAIHFTHVLNIRDMAHGQSLHKKSIQRSEFLKKINRFLDHNSPTEAERDTSGGLVNNQVSPGPTPIIPLTRARSWS